MSPCAAMSEGLKACYNDHRILGLAVCGGILACSCSGVVIAHRWLKRRKAQKIRKAYPRDTVILHDVSRGPYAPSMVPASVKLETYLRMANIPYQYCPGFEKSGKKKFPWITYNGEDVADSAFVIHFLNQRLDLDLSAWLTPEQRGVAVAFQRLAEDNLYWILLVTRCVNEVPYDMLRKAFGLSPFFVDWVMSPWLRKMAWAQGTGRHSHEEVKNITRENLTALTNYLGQKQFLMGERPCEEDCALFGQLAQLYWQLPGSMSTLFREEFPQLVRYCERMKDTFWPDWTQCTTQGGTVPATR